MSMKEVSLKQLIIINDEDSGHALVFLACTLS